MNEHIMKIPFHIDKLSPENQLVIVNLVNHINSSGELYREDVIERLKKSFLGRVFHLSVTVNLSL